MYHVVEEDDDCRPNTVEVCVNSTGQIEKPIKFDVIFYSGSAKGLFLSLTIQNDWASEASPTWMVHLLFRYIYV